jgi:putative transcriptional regulator
MEVINRNQVIQEIAQLLNGGGFETSQVYNHSCFDMAARKKLLLLLLKVFVNIDSVNESHLQEIRKVSNTFLAAPLIVGVKSKTSKLKEDVVYERYGLPVIGIETLKNIVLYDEYPEFLADRGGYFVNINGKILKEYREEYSLSLKDLADLAHVSRETIYKYENDIVRANPETAMLLEDILNMKITVDIDLFEVPTEFTEFNEVNTKTSVKNGKTKDLANLGFGVVETKRTPFDALAVENGFKDMGNSDSPLIASLENNRVKSTLHKMAISLKDLSLITDSESFFIINNKKIKNSLEGIPVIKSWELKEIEDSKEFLNLVKERGDN